MKKAFTSIATILCTILSMAQTIELSFTGRDIASHYVRLSRIIVTDLSQGWQETLFFPDTVLIIQNQTSIDDYAGNDDFVLSQNTPNPFNGITDVNLTVKDAGAVTMEIADINGHTIGTHHVHLKCGVHQFRVSLSAAGTYVMTARQNGKSSSIKMVNKGGGKGNDIEYAGTVETIHELSLQSKSDIRGNATHPFNIGDQMEYVGYAIINNAECESVICTMELAASEEIVIVFEAEVQNHLPTVITDSVTVVFAYDAMLGGMVLDDGGYNIVVKGVSLSTQSDFSENTTNFIIQSGTDHFEKLVNSLSAGTTYYARAYATNTIGTSFGNIQSFTTQTVSGNRCPGIPTVTDINGNVYTTEQIGEQCWMKENLRATHTSTGTPIADFCNPEQGVNSIVQYGRLYKWVDAMNGEVSSDNIPSGVHGICPDGWHIPSDAEWKKLEIFAGMDPLVAQDSGFRSNIAVKLCDSIGWNPSSIPNAAGNMGAPCRNETGFSARAAGDGIAFFGQVSFFWTSTSITSYTPLGQEVYSWQHSIVYNGDCIIRDVAPPDRYYFSIRCLKD